MVVESKEMIYYFFVAVCVHTYFLQVEGQCTAATKPLQINASYTPYYLTSTNYPDPYLANSDCAWIIKAPSEYDKIIINIEHIEIEGITAPCRYDYVAVYDGEDNTATELAKICSANEKSVNALVSSTDTFYVAFISDFAVQYEGFNMLVFSNDTAYQPDCDGNTTYVATSQPQFLMSPNLPDLYQSNFTCLMQIYPETTYFGVSFSMIFMDIESSSGCTKDILRFSSVGETSSVEKAAECTTAVEYEFNNYPLEVSGTYVELDLTTDSDNNYLGFYLIYSEIFMGIKLTSPQNEDTIEYTVSEDVATGHVNESVCVIVLTYTGTLSLSITPSYESTTDRNITSEDTDLFEMTDDPPYAYLGLKSTSSLDYEVINKFSLLVRMIDTDVSHVTYSVTFNITITDIDDVAPTFDNLPGNYTLSRGQKTGELLYTVNATDLDGTAENRKIIYQINSGDTDSLFVINETSGEVRLAQDAKRVPLDTLTYDITIAAYSGSVDSGLDSFSDLTINVFPDGLPECSHDTVWGDTVDVNLAVAGTIVQLLDTWNCSDDDNNITYSIESVSPNLTTTLFGIDAVGEVTLLRKFNITEVVNRQFMLEIGVTDSVGQMVTFDMYMNVTALTCDPNPRNLYIRTDQEIDDVILNDFNCTKKYGLTYILNQYPAGTFDVDSTTNGTALLVLKSSVVKMQFYSLNITITDGVDITVLEFTVFIQAASGAPSISQMSFIWITLSSFVFIF